MRSLRFAWPAAALPLLAALFGIFAAHAAPPSSAPAAPTAAQRKTLELLALGKARTEALQRIRALPLTREAGVGDWVTGSVELDRALRLWVRNRPAEGQLRQYSDAVCEVDVAISPDDLRDQLLRLLDEFGAAAGVRGVDAAAIQAAETLADGVDDRQRRPRRASGHGPAARVGGCHEHGPGLGTTGRRGRRVSRAAR
jgi:hypothetical protein